MLKSMLEWFKGGGARVFETGMEKWFPEQLVFMMLSRIIYIRDKLIFSKVGVGVMCLNI